MTTTLPTTPVTVTVSEFPKPVQVGPSEVKATRVIKAKLDRLREVRALIKPLEAEAKELTDEILAFVGSTTVKRVMWGKTQLATIVNNVNRRNDPAILKAAYPQAYTDSLVEKPFQQIR